MSTAELPPLPLPDSITSGYLDCTSSCGLNFHILTAGKPGKPLVLFCHGFPELAFSWRKLLPLIANAGYYCVAMDQRGYGRTTGWSTTSYHSVDMSEFTLPVLIHDLVCLVYGLGYTTVACIVGHDFGGVSSAMAALMRPDLFHASVQMSHPHHAPPMPPSPSSSSKTEAKPDIQAELAALDPPRKHYKWYNSSPSAAADWGSHASPQELARFLRGYFHLKSGDWAGNHNNNAPRPLAEWSGAALAHMPEYYIMRRSDSFPACVARNMAGEDDARTEAWLSPHDLDVYVAEWTRMGFQGALNWYRRMTMGDPVMHLFAGRRLEVPVAFISGASDWGNYQQPGALEGYEDERVVRKGCFRGVTMIEGAGHWVQQEKPAEAAKALLEFLGSL